MNGQDIVCMIMLASFIVLPIGALLLSAFCGKDTYHPDNVGPKCDICGKPLSEHGMWECEMYC